MELGFSCLCQDGESRDGPEGGGVRARFVEDGGKSGGSCSLELERGDRGWGSR